MEIVTWVLSFAVMVGVLVVVHEMGHFLVAKAFGIGAPVFSIGIGPPLFRLFSWRGTDFVISGLPIGGFVKLAGADPFGEEDADNAWIDPSEDFMRRPVWQRFLVMVAGPAMNLLLPYVLFTAVLVTGEPQPDNSIGTVIPGSPAAELGLQPGDRVVTVEGQPVDAWSEIVRILEQHLGERVPLGVARGDQRLDVILPGGTVKLSFDGLVDTEAIGFWWSQRSSRIGVDDTSSPAWKAGLRPGDAIVEVDGHEVETWEQLLGALSSPEEHHLVRVRPGDAEERAEVTLLPEPGWQSRWPEVDPNPWGLVQGSVFVGEIQDGSAAQRVGLRTGDRFLSIDGQPVRSWPDVLRYVAAAAPGAESEDAHARALDVVLVRDGERVEVTVTPDVKREVDSGHVRYRPIMGVSRMAETFRDGPEIKKFYDLPTAFSRAVEETNMVFSRTFTVLGGFATGRLKFQESIGGPVEIFRVAGESAKEGVFTFVRMIGMISVSLGVVNLLPVPVLDGGQIAVYGIEAIRGRPLSLRVRERIQMAGVLVLAALLLVATVMDVHRLLQG